MVMSITGLLNIWDSMGVFAYVIPFLLIFAVVFAILEKTHILGNNKAIWSIVGLSVGLLSLQFDYVSTFFASIFPKFGIGLAIFLVLIIILGFFVGDDRKSMMWIGYVIGIGVVIWGFINWNSWMGYGGWGYWFSDYFWSIVILALVIGVIVFVGKGNSDDSGRTDGRGPGRIAPPA